MVLCRSHPTWFLVETSWRGKFPVWCVRRMITYSKWFPCQHSRVLLGPPSFFWRLNVRAVRMQVGHIWTFVSSSYKWTEFLYFLLRKRERKRDGADALFSNCSGLTVLRATWLNFKSRCGALHHLTPQAMSCSTFEGVNINLQIQDACSPLQKTYRHASASFTHDHILNMTTISSR